MIMPSRCVRPSPMSSPLPYSAALMSHPSDSFPDPAAIPPAQAPSLLGLFHLTPNLSIYSSLHLLPNLFP